MVTHPTYREFDITIISASNPIGTTVWSSAKGIYVRISVAEQVYETCVVEMGEEWNNAYTFTAQEGQSMIMSLYAVSMSSVRNDDILLGQITECLSEKKFQGQDVTRVMTRTHSMQPFSISFRIQMPGNTSKTRDNSKPEFFALVIGIDEYQSSVVDLRGCKNDARSICDFLLKRLQVPSSHIRLLTDRRATRMAIITSFQSHLIHNSRIRYGDAMLIFYAGHGSEAAAPNGWATDNNKVETICPHDQGIIHDGEQIPGIPDRTVNALLLKLASIKGDNITMIVDSCYSGGITRSGRVPRYAMNPPPLRDDLDRNIWMEYQTRMPRGTLPPGILYKAMASHILLAACGHDELAFEEPLDKGMWHGAFTSHLVQLLNKVDLDRLTYSAIPDLLPKLAGQTPQCEGTNKNRVLFKGVIRATFKISQQNEVYLAHAGDIHGVVKGTLFAIFPSDITSTPNQVLGIMVADSVEAYSCKLRNDGNKMFDVPSGARASVINWRCADDVELKVSLQSTFEDITSIPHVFSCVGPAKGSDLVVRRENKDSLELERLDPIISSHAPVLRANIPPHFGLSNILEAVSHFNFHLYHRNTANPLQQQVEMVLRCLKKTNIYNNLDNPNDAIYEPDGEYDLPLSSAYDNTVVVDTQSTDRTFYGLTLKNHSTFNLFPYIFFFDPSDYSIEPWYHPSPTISAPLASRHTDGKPSIHPVGYGNTGGDTLEFLLAPGVTSDVGFLKLVVSTSNVDLSATSQLSPLKDNRVMGRMSMTEGPEFKIWDSFMYVLRTEKQITTL